jgi:hypothetical protein
MRNMARLVVAVVVVSLLGADALARPWRARGHGGWGPGDHWAMLYDPKVVETIRGTVARIDVVKRRPMAEGVHLIVATADARVDVHLGPAWFLENQEIALAVGDVVEVRGARVTFQGKPAIIAAEVARGDDVLVLRDDSGRPRWAAWRRGGPGR